MALNRQKLREKALQIARDAHAPEAISAWLLILEAERIAEYIEKGSLPKDVNSAIDVELTAVRN